MNNNNIYVRNKTSIKTILLTRLLFIFPLIIYGCYKNGVYLYIHDYGNIFDLFRPIILILIGALIGGFVNIFYEKIIKRNKDNIIDVLFSSFHIEYGILLACISSVNTNILIFSLITLGMLFISKFFKNRINIIALTFILIYLLSIVKGNYIFANTYELSKNFQLNLFDYLIGRGPGGLAATHIILIGLAIAGLYLTNNNKNEITINASLSYGIPVIIYSLITKQSILESLFLNNYIFIFSFIATDTVTSCYTNKGKQVFGILIGLFTFAFRFLNPILAPFISVALISLLNNLIDRKVNRMKN